MNAFSRRVAVLLLALVCAGVVLPGVVAAQAPTDAPKVFKPLDQLPPAEQLPAANLLVAAYVVVILVLFFYVVSLARRLTTVQGEVERLEASVKRAGRS